MKSALTSYYVRVKERLTVDVQEEQQTLPVTTPLSSIVVCFVRTLAAVIHTLGPSFDDNEFARHAYSLRLGIDVGS